MKLTIDTTCLLSTIIDKTEINDDFIQEMIKLGKTAKGKGKEFAEDLKKQIGLKVVIKITSKIHLAKDELIEFVASYKEISKEEARKIDLIDIIKELMNDKDFISFFKQELMSE
jgi:hypothetical protein